MRSPAKGTKPRKVETASIPAPTLGLISNRNLATPGQGAAAICDNFFPTPEGLKLRRGLARHATLPAQIDVKSLIAYNKDGLEQLFAIDDTGIYDVTTVAQAYGQAISPDGVDIIGTDVPDQGIGWFSIDPDDNLQVVTDGYWHSVQFSTAGGTFLIGVNGVDDAWIYDGISFEPLGVTFPGGSTLTTADLSFVWVYQTRIYFLERGSLNAWYLPVDQIGGVVTLLPLGGTFVRGGSLVFGQSWSLSSGGDGGLSDQCVFVTTEGEVAIFQGLSPDSIETWNKVGVYQVGKPLGPRGFIRAGGDLVIATTIGLIPLSRAIDLDTAALGANAVSANITDTWREAVQRRGMERWVCKLWPEGSMMMVAPPTIGSQEPVSLVAHADTGAWATFTAWQPLCMELFRGRLFFGSIGGAIQEAWISGQDEGRPYTGVMLPFFADGGTSLQKKTVRVGRVVRRAAFPSVAKITAKFDWDMSRPAAPDAPTIPSAGVWDAAIWDQFIWDSEPSNVIEQEWQSLGGLGYAVSAMVQVTSGAPVPLDVEIVRVDLTYESADIIS